MKVGDLVRVKLPSVQAYFGIVIKPNNRGGALVRSFDGKFDYWVNSWSGEVVSESKSR